MKRLLFITFIGVMTLLIFLILAASVMFPYMAIAKKIGFASFLIGCLFWLSATMLGCKLIQIIKSGFYKKT